VKEGKREFIYDFGRRERFGAQALGFPPRHDGAAFQPFVQKGKDRDQAPAPQSLLSLPPMIAPYTKPMTMTQMNAGMRL
jgi:hypothetical protein